MFYILGNAGKGKVGFRSGPPSPFPSFGGRKRGLTARMIYFELSRTCAILLPLRVGEWLSLVEHLVRDQGVGGSNPLSPTNVFKQLKRTSGFSSTAM